MRLPKYQNGFISFVGILLALVVIIIVGIAYYTLHSHIISQQTFPIKHSTQQLQPTRSATPSASKPPKNIDEITWRISKNDGSASNKIVEFNDYDYKNIARWQNQLLFTRNTSGKSQLVSYNLNTSQETVLYTTAKDTQQVSGLIVVGDTLYFSVGGYLVEGGVYYIDLTQSSSAHLIATENDGYVEKIRDFYWVRGGFGDACGSSTWLSLLDVSSKTMQHIVTLSDGCGGGDNNLGVDPQDRLLVAHSEPQNANDPTAGTIITNVTAIHVNSPKEKDVILSTSQLPPNTTDIRYLEDTNTLVLLADKLYVFDITSNSLKALTTHADQLKNKYIEYIDDKILCLSEENTAGSVSINILSGEITQNTTSCQGYIDDKTLSDITTFIKQLNLPKDYSINEI